MKLIGSTVSSSAVEYLTYASDYSGNPSCVDRSLSVEPAESFTIVTVNEGADANPQEAGTFYTHVGMVRTVTSRF